MNALDLAVLCNNSVALAADVAEYRRSVEVNAAQGLGEAGVRVSQEADAALLVGVQVLAPGLHDEGVVDRHDDDVAGCLCLLRCDVAGDVRLGAAGACGRAWLGWNGEDREEEGVGRRTEGGGDADDQALALGQVLGQVDLGSWGTVVQLDAGDGVADVDHGDD